ncbi:MAG TPA: ester cyclase [Dongiaceae bacterium]|nr:ester cyclase [Dongiaceae bacterium]
MNEANEALIRRLFAECFNRHSTDLYPDFYSDVIYHAPAIGELHGDAHRQFLLSFFAAFPDAHWNLEDLITVGDKVVARWTFIGTHRGIFMGIPATERQLVLSGICIDRILQGKIVEEWEQWDTLAMMQQLDVVSVETNIGDLIAP